MSSDQAVQSKGLSLKIPDTLSLKDLITVISVAISLTIAWGVFSTRIAILEKDVVALKEYDKNLSAAAEKGRKQVRRLESQQQDDELLLDQIFILVKRPIPQRRARDTE